MGPRLNIPLHLNHEVSMQPKYCEEEGSLQPDLQGLDGQSAPVGMAKIVQAVKFAIQWGWKKLKKGVKRCGIWAA